jgi:hypothetical protein
MDNYGEYIRDLIDEKQWGKIFYEVHNNYHNIDVVYINYILYCALLESDITIFETILDICIANRYICTDDIIIIEVVKKGYTNNLQKLLNYIPINTIIHLPLLYIACEYSHINTLKYLINIYPIDDNLLYYAASKTFDLNLSILKVLLSVYNPSADIINNIKQILYNKDLQLYELFNDYLSVDQLLEDLSTNLKI